MSMPSHLTQTLARRTRTNAPARTSHIAHWAYRLAFGIGLDLKSHAEEVAVFAQTLDAARGERKCAWMKARGALKCA
jgi:hypothetical protein